MTSEQYVALKEAIKSDPRTRDNYSLYQAVRQRLGDEIYERDSDAYLEYKSAFTEFSRTASEIESDLAKAIGIN